MEFTSKNFDEIIKDLDKKKFDYLHIKLLNNKVFNIQLSDINSESVSKQAELVIWMLQKISTIKKLLDREFFVVFTDTSIVAKNTFTLKNFERSKYTIPSAVDHLRIKNNVFGIEDMNNMKWFDKEDTFLCQNNYTNIITFVKNELRHKLIDRTENDTGYKPKFVICSDYDALSTLLFSGSCILFVEPEKRVYNWFSDKLISGTHYISIKNTFSNLNEKVLWCINNDSLCENVALQARDFSCKELGFSGTFNHWVNIMNSLLPSVNEYGYWYIQYNHQLQYLIEHFKVFSSRKECISEKTLNWDAIIDYGNGKLDYSSLYACKNMINSNNKYLFDSVMKSIVSKKIYQNEDVYKGINDLFVGIRCINDVCANIPNFEYTFYGDVLDAPLKVYKDNVYSLNIETFLTELPSQTENCLVQLCLALQLAWERHGFMHGNLNPETVRVITLKHKIKITYTLDENIFVIYTKFIVYITDYSESVVFSSFNMNNKRMVIGNFDRTEALTKEKLDNIMHAKGISNTTRFTNKIFGKKLGKIVKEDIFGLEYKPKALLENYVSLDDKIDNTSVEFVTYNPINTLNCLTNKDPKIIVKDVFTNEIPVESTPLGNVILQYELSQNIKSALINCDVNFSVNVISKEITKILNFFSRYYDRLIEKQISFDNEKDYNSLDEDEIWVIKNYIKKYFGPITKSRHGKYILAKLNKIIYRSVKELINVCILNTLEFQHK